MRTYGPGQRLKAEKHAEKVSGDVRLDGYHGDMFVTESREDTESLRVQAEEYFEEPFEERYPLLARFFRSNS